MPGGLIDELLRARRFNRPSNIEANRQIVADDLVEQTRRDRIQAIYDAINSQFEQEALLNQQRAELARTTQQQARVEGLPEGAIANLGGTGEPGSPFTFTNVHPETGQPIITTPEQPVPRGPITPETLKGLASALTTVQSATPEFVGGLREERLRKLELANELEKQRIASEAQVSAARLGAKGGNLTDTQRTNQALAGEMTSGFQTLEELQPELAKKGVSWWKRNQLAPKFLQDELYQKYYAAAFQFLNPAIYLTSGKQINESEFERLYQQFFPTGGETENVMEQLRQARFTKANEGLKAAGLEPLPTTETESQNATKQLDDFLKSDKRPEARTFIMTNRKAKNSDQDIYDALKENGYIK